MGHPIVIQLLTSPKASEIIHYKTTSFGLIISYSYLTQVSLGLGFVVNEEIRRLFIASLTS